MKEEDEDGAVVAEQLDELDCIRIVSVRRPPE
jgi:hypothetical protein